MRTFSYWEKEFMIGNTDIAIIGSGIVGLSSALFIKRKYPTLDVSVFEQGVLPSGATSRNAGFACFGMPGELMDDLQSQNADIVWNTVEKRFKGLKMLLQTLGETHIGYNPTGGYELYTRHTQGEIEISANAISDLNHNIRHITGILETFVEKKPKGLQNIEYSIYNPLEGLVNSGKLMNRLLSLAQFEGVRYFPGFKLKRYEHTSDGLELIFDFGHEMVIKSQILALCTNAFTPQLIPDMDIKPGRGLVLVTRKNMPLPEVAAYHHNAGYDYFRTDQDRLLIGGGRDKDLLGEESLEWKTNGGIKNYLMELANEYIIPLKETDIEYEWQGFMAFGKTKNPIIQKMDDRVYTAVRLGGMGVAIGTQTALELSEIICL